MVKQLVIPLVAVALFIIAVGMFVQKSGTLNIGGLPAGWPVTETQKTITVAGKSITVELANTKELRVKGLSLRANLGQDSGMLFTFDTQDVTPSFWMKDMLIPLDIIWIKAGAIVKVDKNVPLPAAGTPDNKLKIYSPGQPIDYVLEVNAGFADNNGVNVGSIVDLSKI